MQRPPTAAPLLCARTVWIELLSGIAVVLLGLPGPQAHAVELITPFTGARGDEPPEPWQVRGFPGSNKPLSLFDVVTIDGHRALRVRADKSYGNLQHDLPAIRIGPGTTLNLRWRLDKGLSSADLRQKSGDDVAIRVCALFDMPSDTLGFFERTFLFAARRISDQYVPAATLCYVWDDKLPVGTQLPNAFTRRVRYIVLDSSGSALQTWIEHERDLVKDFLSAFGDESATVPPLIGLLVGADADNTEDSSLAYVRNLGLRLTAPTNTP